MARKKTFLVVFVVAAVLIAAVTGSVYNATQHVPDFYTEALHVEPTTAHETGEVLEEQVFAFSNQVKKPRPWSLRLTDKQINSWLAADLKEKFPELLPEHIEDPRIAVKGKTLLVGCKYNGQSLNSILAVSLDCFLLEGEPNVVGIQLHNVTAGALPIPLGQLISEIDTYAGKAEIPIRWQQRDGDPVALITIPSTGKDIEGEIRIEALEFKDGEILLSGKTIKTEEELEEEAVAAPQDPPASSPMQESPDES
ncbi:hypothetical protein HOV93_47420 [Planctomycetes bacterium FF15]|uniref:Uncharacterized protein n=1 Tax=Bremerella alba TaxID=980252 RepID=A0A7V8V9R3_9BACT|nr:hypothetical protein [Bremerella alba]